VTYEGFTYTGTCGDCGSHVTTQDPELLVGWQRQHWDVCPFWNKTTHNME